MNRRIPRLAADAALWLGAILGGLAMVITLTGLIFGVRPLIFRSGSMSPTISTGSLAFSHQIPVQQVRVGDIVSVPTQGTRLTHRVVAVIKDGGLVRLQLRGDANPSPDAQLYRVSSVDKVWFSVPRLGFVLAWLSRPPGIFALALYAAGMLAVIFRGGRATDDDAGGGRLDDHRSDDHRPRRAAGKDHPGSVRFRAALGAGLLGGTAALGATPSWAAFTDTVPVSGTAISTATVPTTTLSCGTLGVLSVNFTWTAVPAATSYTLHYGSNAATVTGTSFTISAAISGGTAYVTVNRNFGSVTWTSANSNTRTFTVAVVSLCS